MADIKARSCHLHTEALFGSYPQAATRNLPFRIVEGFRAPTGVLNPDRYDPRIGKRQAMGISDSVGSAVPTQCYLTVVRTA